MFSWPIVMGIIILILIGLVPTFIHRVYVYTAAFYIGISAALILAVVIIYMWAIGGVLNT